MIKWLERHFLPCPVKEFTGKPCLGCGMQRSIIELLKGNIIESIIYYPALLTLALMFIFLGLHLKFDFKHGANILKISFIINAIIISLNFIIKLTY
jgi:hypothetical protein